MSECTAWSCTKCTYDNQLSSKSCEICGALRENSSSTKEWKCSSCTFVNACSAETCLICDSPATMNNDSLNNVNNNIEIENKTSSNTVFEPIQNNYVPSATHCGSIEQCDAIKRILKVLHYYQTIKDMNAEDADCNKLLLDYFEKYKDLINDYHHILTVHLNTNTKHDNNKNFESIHNKTVKLIKCDISQCEHYRNNNRNRGRPNEKEQIKDKKSLYYIDWLDSIHCYLIHSFDVGFRIKISDYYHNKGNVNEQKQSNNNNNNTNDIDAELIYHDYEMERIKMHLSNKRKNLENIRGIDRVQNSKFNTSFRPNIQNETMDENIDGNKESKQQIMDENIDGNKEKKQQIMDETKNNTDIDNNELKTDKDEGNVMMIGYFFGNRFLYWDWFKNNAALNKWFISPKYSNLKEEMMNNNIYNIEHDQYIETYQKAYAILNDSFVVRSMKSTANYWYKIQDNVALDIEHVLSIIFYTDYDTLSYNFTKTYRKTSISESDESLKKRNSEYWNWGKLITEIVECYGTPLHSSNILTFYHGTSMLYFDSFVTKFCCPTSTTPQIQVAAMFAKSDGIILELEKFAGGFDLKYFNCSLFSCYGNEDERLFAGGYKELQLKSIRTMADNKNYEYFIHALRLFDKFINGKKLTPEDKKSITNRDYKIIDQLANGLLNNEYVSKHPVYIKKCFERFVFKTKTIVINMEEVNNSYKGYMKYFGESGYDNLISIDQIALIFHQCQQINLTNVGTICIIDKYISSVLSILKEIHNNTKTKLINVAIYYCQIPKTQKNKLNSINMSVKGWDLSTGYTHLDGHNPGCYGWDEYKDIYVFTIKCKRCN